MIKNKIDFKLINIVLILIAVFIVYNLNTLFAGIINTLLKITGPFIIAFALAYAIEPALNFLISKNIKKNIAILIIVISFILIMGVIFALVIPMLIEQLTSLFGAIIIFIKDLINNNNLDLGPLQETLNNSFNGILGSLGGVATNGAIGVISASMGILSSVFIVFSATVYFLIDMNKMRTRLKEYLYKKSKNFADYISLLDKQMKMYFTGFFRIILITVTEYTLIYAIIGHPHALLIGVLAGLGNLIPVFGALIVNGIGLMTAAVISKGLLIRVIVVVIITSILDSYVINPLVYKKTNQVPPILILLSVFAGASLFGFIGVVISIPVTIIIMATINFYKIEINQQIDKVKAKTN